MKNLNINWFEKKKLALLTLSSCIAVGLTGCISDPHKDSDTGYVDRDKYSIDICYDNYNTEIAQKETILFIDSEKNIYRMVNIALDGTTESYISSNDDIIVSEYLDKEIVLPETDEEHKIIVNIDYNTKSVNVELEELEKTNIR